MATRTSSCTLDLPQSKRVTSLFQELAAQDRADGFLSAKPKRRRVTVKRRRGAKRRTARRVKVD